MSLITDIADAVVAELNAAPPEAFSQVLNAQRRVLPQFEPEELSDLQVSVVPKRLEITGATRAASQYEIAIDIGVQRRLGRDLDAEVAELGTLVDQIADYLRRRPLSGIPGIPGLAWVSTVNEPVYSPEHLAEQRVFTSVLTVTYRALR
jgi:hypothetical protein